MVGRVELGAEKHLTTPTPTISRAFPPSAYCLPVERSSNALEVSAGVEEGCSTSFSRSNAARHEGREDLRTHGLHQCLIQGVTSFPLRDAVVMVVADPVFCSCKNWKATLVPGIAIPWPWWVTFLFRGRRRLSPKPAHHCSVWCWRQPGGG